jgi:flavin reductase (DIM6/NTAB) family NADH-FMN oxidoreductase RutF
VARPAGRVVLYVDVVTDMQGTFHKLVGDLDYSMFVVTTVADGERAGCLVGFASQTSIEPPRFLVCLSRNNRTYRVARTAELLAVHFVPRRSESLARLFGGCSGDDVDKFARCAWHPGPGGVPVVEACDNWFAGRVLDQVDLGDHVGFLLEPVEAYRRHREATFEFHRAKRIEPGHPA